jgi:hypothetical protein
LFQGPLELAMALLNIAILVRFRRVDGLALQTVMLEQVPITLLEHGPVLPRRHGGRQRIGAMHLRHAAQFRQGVLQARAEALEALAEADRPRLPVGVGQHEVVDQVRERLATDRDLQAGAVREVGRAQPARLMDLGEEDFLGRAVQSPPLLDTPLQGSQLLVGEAAGIFALQPGEQSFGFQAVVERQLLLDLVPDLGKGIGFGSPGMIHMHLAGQLTESPVLAGGLPIHVGFGSRLTFGQVHQVAAT